MSKSKEVQAKVPLFTRLANSFQNAFSGIKQMFSGKEEFWEVWYDFLEKENPYKLQKIKSAEGLVFSDDELRKSAEEFPNLPKMGSAEFDDWLVKHDEDIRTAEMLENCLKMESELSRSDYKITPLDDFLASSPEPETPPPSPVLTQVERQILRSSRELHRS